MNDKIIKLSPTNPGRKYNIPKGISSPVSNSVASGLPCTIAISNINTNTDIKNNVIMLL